MLIGDSHSNMFTYMFEALRADIGLNFIQFGRGSCPPFLKYESEVIGCTDLAEKAFVYATNSPNITTVIFAARWPSNLEQNSAYINAFRNTIHAYEGIGGKTIIFFKVPNPADPKSCLDRKFKISKNLLCNTKLDEAISKDGNYRIALSALNSNTEIFDPWDFLCESDYCKTIDNNKILYYDESHLSLYGGELLAREGKQTLINIIEW